MKARYIGVILVATVVFLTSTAWAADDATRMVRFSRLHGATYKLEGPMGWLEIFFDAMEQTQLRGVFRGTTFSSLPDGSQIQLTNRELGKQDGRPYLKFKAGEMDVFISNNYGVNEMPEPMRKMWQEMSPGSIVNNNGRLEMPTAVVVVSEAGLNVQAAFPQQIPLQ